MHQGLFLVIEGSDGSGKVTQFKLLAERLKSEGYEVATYDFPQYEKETSYFVRQYLNDHYGTAGSLGAYLPSLFYALDRFEASQTIQADLDAGKVVLSNRFVGSNMAHQSAKLATEQERRQLFTWLEQLEFDFLGAPRPDLSIVLLVPAETSQRLVGKKATRSYTEHSHDIHEADLQHLINATEGFRQLCREFPESFTAIECTEEGELLSIPTINNLVWQKIQPLLPAQPKLPTPKTVVSEETVASTVSTIGNKVSLLATQSSSQNLATAGHSEHLSYYIPGSLDTETSAFYQAQMEQLLDYRRNLQERLLKYEPRASPEALLALLPLATQFEPSDSQLSAEQVSQFETKIESSPPGEVIAQRHQLQPFKGSQTEPVTMISWQPRNEFNLLPDLLYQHSSLAARDLTMSIDNWSYVEKETSLNQLLAEKSTTLDEARYSFELLTDYVSYLSLPPSVRQRAKRQPFTPLYGFSTPAAIIQAGVENLYEDIFEISRNLYQALMTKGYQNEAEYTLLAGHLFSWRLNLSAADLTLLLANPDSTELANKLKTEIRKVHPIVSKFITQ